MQLHNCIVSVMYTMSTIDVHNAPHMSAIDIHNAPYMEALSSSQNKKRDQTGSNALQHRYMSAMNLLCVCFWIITAFNTINKTEQKISIVCVNK